MYYPYPPMPQVQLDENGQPMPMYYPYPPMPQAQLDENGQLMPMYYPYPPMPQVQLNENGQPMPMYYPYPPMPQAQQAPQVSQNPPSESFEQRPQSDKNRQNTYSEKQAAQTQTEEQSSVNSDELKVDGREVTVSQPVINTEGVFADGNASGEGHLLGDDMVVREPRKNDSIFSAPTPVYNPQEEINKQDSAYVKEKEPKEDNYEDNGSFMSSMKNLYSAFGESDTVAEKKESANVSDEPLPDFTPTIDGVTNASENIKTVYSVPVQNVSTPVEVDPSQFADKDMQSENARQKEQFSLNRMYKQQEEIKSDEQVNQLKNQDYQSAPYAPQAEQGKESYSVSTHDNSAKEQQQADEGEKDSQYWEFMNNLLSRFDDGEIHTEIGGNRQEQQIPAPPNFAHLSQDFEPDQSSLSNFGKNVEKTSAERISITRATKELKDNFEPGSVEENFGEFNEKKAARAEKLQKNKPKKAKKEKQTKELDNSYKGENKGFKKFLVSTFPMRGDSTKEIIRKLVVIISFIVLVGCGIYFTVNFVNKKQNENEVLKLSQIMKSSESSAEEWAKIKNKYPNVDFPSGMQAKFADLYAMNPDLVGWIKIDGLDIDLPVVQTKDNEYYLKHNFSKEKSIYGTIFLNFNNKIDTLDLNTVLFGHRMHKDTQMFTNLREYAKPEGFIKAPVIEFNTLYGNYKWKVFAVFITNGSSDGDNGYVFNYVFPNLAYRDKKQWEETYGGYINQINQRALYYTGVEIMPTDRLLTLSTCTYEFDNARLVVVARMLRPNESVEIDKDQIKINENIRYPQAWYDKRGEANPYKDEPQWKPVV